MPSYQKLDVKPIAREVAKSLVLNNHYMKTFPQGAKVHLGIYDTTTNKLAGVAVFGYSSSTEQKVKKLVHDIDPTQYIEMQRLWISDQYGHNSESWVLAKIIKLFKQNTNLKIIFTHAGGCKNDCGIVYQASAWLYFGKTKCDDFYLTAAGEYKNIIAAMRFGRVKAKGKTPQQIGEQLFGPGQIINSFRYYYIYPIDKGIRRRLQKLAQPYPKDSTVFRKNQEWQCGGSAGAQMAACP